ncbi:hypothetical protein [Fluviispira vulneris]|uniref:hypothetical protein n=1 Tax=Fluviispira vulneris TaxID=2763012 RepID=UPI001645CB1F|nr:hypothetical protein [Fluviispira vulneris]
MTKVTFISFLLFSILFSSCETADNIWGKSFIINAMVKRESNNNFAFETDIVVVKKDEFHEKILKYTNQEWFDDSYQELVNLKKTKDLKIFKVYTVPQYIRKSIAVNLPPGCKQIYLFNRYNALLKSYPLKIDTESNVTIIFNENQIEVKESGRTKQERDELETVIRENESNENV